MDIKLRISRFSSYQGTLGRQLSCPWSWNSSFTSFLAGGWRALILCNMDDLVP